jgi:hypothetical protein
MKGDIYIEIVGVSNLVLVVERLVLRAAIDYIVGIRGSVRQLQRFDEPTEGRCDDPYTCLMKSGSAPGIAIVDSGSTTAELLKRHFVEKDVAVVNLLNKY